MPDSAQQLLLANSQRTGIPLSWLQAEFQIESGNGTNTTNPHNGLQGALQITQDTWNGSYGLPGVPYQPNNLPLEMECGANLLSNYGKQFNNDLVLVDTAYGAGYTTGKFAQQNLDAGQSPVDAVTNAVNRVYGPNSEVLYQSLDHTAKFLAANNDPRAADFAAAAEAAKTTAGADLANYGVDNSDPALAVKVSGTTYSSPGQVATLIADQNPPLVVDYAGLKYTPWYADSNLVLPNRLNRQAATNYPASGQNEFPITFQIYYDRAMTQALGLPGAPPISIRLNASLQQHTREMRHSSNRRQTRTGVLLTLWDMHPDIITGTATTGLFMNQMGVTDFLSLTNPSSEVHQMFKAGRISPPPPVPTPPAKAPKSGKAQPPATPAASAVADPYTAMVAAEGLRVAAKDAFVEFLSMFRNNGIVWLNDYKEDYGGPLTQLNQTGPNAWSPTTGSSTYQMSAQLNDVRTRGYVVMRFRNSMYAGYFNTMTWTMDAANPFRWVFNFTFKVEKTITAVPITAGGIF